MEEKKDQNKLDVDYLFDNFEEFCEIEFKKNLSKSKQPSIVRNLSTLFDKVAKNGAITKEAEPSLAAKPPRKSKSKSKKRVVKSSLDKSTREDCSAKNKFIRKKLKLNLHDVFAAELGFQPNRTAQDSVKSRGANGSCSKNGLMQFIRMKTEVMNHSQYPKKEMKKHSSTSKGKLSTEFNGKKACVKLSHIFNSKEILGGIAGLKKTSSKQSITNLEANPLTGSTRIQTTTSRQGSNKRSNSFIETENKLPNKSCRNLRGESFLASANINSILNSSKHLNGKLTKKKEEKHAGLSKEAKEEFEKVLKKNQLAKSEKTQNTLRKVSHSKSKYYIPAHLGFKAPKTHQHNSFTYSEDFSQLGKNTYLHRILFPRLLSKAEKRDHSRDKSCPKK